MKLRVVEENLDFEDVFWDRDDALLAKAIAEMAEEGRISDEDEEEFWEKGVLRKSIYKVHLHRDFDYWIWREDFDRLRASC